MVDWITGLGVKTWTYILLFVFFLAFIRKVYEAGGDSEKTKQLEKQLNAVVKRQEIENDVDGLSDSAVLSLLRSNGWIRK